MEPKAMGVKTIRKIRINLMKKFNIAQSSKLKGKHKELKGKDKIAQVSKFKAESKQ